MRAISPRATLICCSFRDLDLLLTLDLFVHDLHLLTLRRHVRDGARLVGLLRDGGEAHVGVLLGLLLRDEVLVALGLGVAPLLGLALGGILLHLRLADPRLLDLLGQLGLTEGGDVVIVVSDFLDDEGRDPHAHADEIDGGRAVHLFGESLAVHEELLGEHVADHGALVALERLGARTLR